MSSQSALKAESTKCSETTLPTTVSLTKTMIIDVFIIIPIDASIEDLNICFISKMKYFLELSFINCE